MSILIVEDNPVNAKVLMIMLRGEGYQTLVAGNGKQALETVSTTAGIQLIITDYMMPEMDGLEFIEKLRALPTFNHVPILVASAYGDLDTVKRAQSVRCDGFLVKPIDKAQLIKRVKQLLRSQPVLLDDHVTMDRFGFVQKDYNALIDEFETQVATVIPIVVLEQGDSDEPLSENLEWLLKELAESASTVGANKFARLYSGCMDGGRLTRSHCPVLLGALQELDMALVAYTQSQLKAMDATDAA